MPLSDNECIELFRTSQDLLRECDVRDFDYLAERFPAPVGINPDLKRPERPLVAYDNRQYPSPESIPVGYNGFTNLNFRVNQLWVAYRDLKNNLLLSESWRTINGNFSGTPDIDNQVPYLTQ